jgi:hypothetical protein
MDKLPPWVYFMSLGVAMLAWIEARFALRRECRDKHQCVDTALAERKESTHALRNEVQANRLELAIIRNDLDHTIEVIEAVAETVGANGFTPRRRRERRKE